MKALSSDATQASAAKQLWQLWQASAHKDSERFWDQLFAEKRSDLLSKIPVAQLGALYEASLSEQRQTGVYYTPTHLAAYLVGQTLGQYLARQYNRLETALKAAAQSRILTEVQGIRICDPACGSGVFLIDVLTQLHQFYGRCARDFGLETPNATTTLCEQLVGVDVDPGAIRVARYSLKRHARDLDAECPSCGHSASGFGDSIVCGDALETGDSDFRWEALPGSARGFQFILGNPPYVTEVRQNADYFRALRTQSRIANRYTAKMDLCDAFFYLGLDLLAPGGELAYVLPEYWMHRESARPLRQYLWEHTDFRELWTFGQHRCFETAPGHHTSLAIVRKRLPKAISTKTLRDCLTNTVPVKPDQVDPSQLSPGKVFLSPGSQKFVVGPSELVRILERLSQQPPLLEARDIQQGIVFPQSRLREKDWKKLPRDIQQKTTPGQGIFVLTEEEVAALDLLPTERALLKPFYETRHFSLSIDDSTVPFLYHPHQYVLYIDNRAKHVLESHPEDYPNVIAHLNSFEPILTSAHRPFGLHRPRQPHWFEGGARILCKRQTDGPAFACAQEPAYVNEGFYIIRCDKTQTAHWLTAILNSRLAHFWFYHQKRKGRRLQIDKDVLVTFPAPMDPSKIQTGTVSNLDAMIYAGYGIAPGQIKSIETTLAEL